MIWVLVTIFSNHLCFPYKKGHTGQAEEFRNWVTHIDSLLHVCLLEDHQDRDLVLPTALKYVAITPRTKPAENKGIVIEEALHSMNQWLGEIILHLRLNTLHGQLVMYGVWHLITSCQLCVDSTATSDQCCRPVQI